MGRFPGSVAAAMFFLASPALLFPGGEDPALPPVGSAGGPSRALTWKEAERWLAGRELFNRAMREPDGLGAPGFNAESCAFCHKDPALGGAGGQEVDVVTLRGASHYDLRANGGNRQLVARHKRNPSGGNQLALMHEVRARLLADGESLAVLDVRQTPSLLGLGLVDTIPDEEILRNEDAEDADGDGVRGVARRVAVGDKTEVGRFGWKAEVPRLADFVCRALGGELGLTAPDQGRGFGLVEDDDGVTDPETSQDALDALDFFVAHLAAPERGAASGPVAYGRVLFERIGCAACHVPVLHGSDGPVALYSDLLLHEIQGPESDVQEGEFVRFHAVQSPRTDKVGRQARDIPEHRFRTPPLWGIGRTAPYLHDGRAKTLTDAVLAHAVEAAWARESFARLAPGDQEALFVFLMSL